MSKPLSRFDGLEITGQRTLDELVAGGQLLTIVQVSKQTGLSARWLRRLCHGEKPTVDHYRLLGRYYMTPAQVAAMLTRKCAHGA